MIRFGLARSATHRWTALGSVVLAFTLLGLASSALAQSVSVNGVAAPAGVTVPAGTTVSVGVTGATTRTIAATQGNG